jgi:glycosyltransferase involved in cell wall biosynthesis
MALPKEPAAAEPPPAATPQPAVRRPSALVLARDLDINAYQELVESGEQPRHYAYELRERAGTELITLAGVEPDRLDRMLGRLIGEGRQWALMRRLGKSLAPDTYLYLTDETLGFPYLLLHGFRGRAGRNMAMFLMGVDSTRVRLWLRVLRLTRARPSFITDTDSAAEVIARLVHIDRRSIAVLPIAIDEDFYSPSARPVVNPRPLIVSAGVEMRDYTTLCEAIEPLDVDVIIVAESSSMSASPTVRIPNRLPANVTIQKVSTRGLRDLYRQSDLVVVPTRDNTMGAGATVALEAISTGRPLILTKTAGLLPLVDAGVAVGVGVGAADQLRAAIEGLLADPARRQALAADGRQFVLQTHATCVFVDRLIDVLTNRSLADTTRSAER